MGQPYAMLLRLAPGLRTRPRLHEEGANMQLGLACLAAKASWAWACACVCVRVCADAWFDGSGYQAGRPCALEEMSDAGALRKRQAIAPVGLAFC